MLDQSSNKPDGECMVLASAVHIAFKLFDHFLQLERFQMTVERPIQSLLITTEANGAMNQ